MAVEDVAAQDRTVIGEIAPPRPRAVDLAAAVYEPHADEAVPAVGERIDAEAIELGERAGREHVAARLVARHRPFLDDGDVVAGSGQPGTDRRSGGATADDEDVGVQPDLRQPAEPGIGAGPTGATSTSPNVSVSSVVKSYSPASIASNTGDSSEHHVSYSASNSSLAGSAPPSV